MDWENIVDFVYNIWDKDTFSSDDILPIKNTVINYFGFPFSYDAFDFTLNVYKDFGFKKRKNGDPWPIHEISVAHEMREANSSTKAILVGFNHDKLEDLFKVRLKRLQELGLLLTLPFEFNNAQDDDLLKKELTSLQNIIYNSKNIPELNKIKSDYGNDVANNVVVLSNQFFLSKDVLKYVSGNLDYMKKKENYLMYANTIADYVSNYDSIPLEVKLADHINHLETIDGIFDQNFIFRAIEKTSFFISIAYDLQKNNVYLPSSTYNLLQKAESVLENTRSCTLNELPKNKLNINETNINVEMAIKKIKQIRKYY